MPVVIPIGTQLQLIANASTGGHGTLYDIVQTDKNNPSTNTIPYQFNQGNTTLVFNADQVGKHILYFVVNNIHSNSVAVDVTYVGAMEAFGFVEGRVYNQKNGVGLPSAEMTIDGNPTSIMTDAFGNYRVKIQPGPHRIGARSSDYSITSYPVIIYQNQTKKQDLKAKRWLTE